MVRTVENHFLNSTFQKEESPGIAWSVSQVILSSGKDSMIWESDHVNTLGSGPLIIWDPEHPLGYGTWGTLSSGIRTLYPLGKCYLGIEV